MATGVLMPKEGITVEECVITKWEKKVGDKVEVGDVLFSYETDKAAFECASTAAGEILEIFYDEGVEVPVLVNVCAVGTAGEDVSSLRPGEATEAKKEEAPAQAAPAASAPAEVQVQAASVSAEKKISPRARNFAAKNGVDASLATPTGPYGRVVESDVRAVIESGAGSGLGGRVTAADKAAVAAVPAQSDEILYEDVSFTKIRSIIAKSMHDSLSNAAQLTHHHSFNAEGILDLRASLKASAERLSLPNITLNDIVLFAVSRTLMNYPDINANLLDGNVLRRFRDVHLGMAIDTPRGLMVPTIFFANRKSLAEIAAEAKRLTAQAREGTISPDLLTGGTFTVSNLGAMGVEMFTPVINPPQTGILGVCAVKPAPAQVGSEIKIVRTMGLSFTYDHRAVDGAPAARFMQELCANLENFSALLVK